MSYTDCETGRYLTESCQGLPILTLSPARLRARQVPQIYQVLVSFTPQAPRCYQAEAGALQRLRPYTLQRGAGTLQRVLGDRPTSGARKTHGCQLQCSERGRLPPPSRIHSLYPFPRSRFGRRDCTSSGPARSLASPRRTRAPPARGGHSAASEGPAPPPGPPRAAHPATEQHGLRVQGGLHDPPRLKKKKKK